MSDYSIDQVRHSAAHILAMAASRIYPEAKIGVGPVTKDGFYYDFEFNEPLTWDQVKRIESEMNLIIQEDLPFTQVLVPKESAYQILLTRGQVYKAELLQEVPDAEISFYKTGEEFIDLCRGPHVASTGNIGAVKITSLESAHWRGDKSRPKMQRINGVAFKDLVGLREYLEREEAIQNRDFRKLAKDMQISIGGSRYVKYTPKGTTIVNTLIDKVQSFYNFPEEVLLPPERGYSELFSSMDELFSMKNRSYRELPISYKSLNRLELAKPVSVIDREIFSVNSLSIRSYFDQTQVSNVIPQHMDSIIKGLQSLDLKFSATISAPGQSHIGLEIASNALHRAGVSQTQIIDANLQPYELIIQFSAKDIFQREWDLVELRMDLSEVKYVAKSGEFENSLQVTVVWVMEKLTAFFLEELDGGLPMWLSPIQIEIIPITEDQVVFSEHIYRVLEADGFRVELDSRSETMQSRIRDAELIKTPVILIIGEKEANTNSVSIRLRNKTEVGLVGEDTLLETLYNLKV